MRRLAPLVFLFSLVACSDAPLRVIDVSLTPDGEDLSGPYTFAAVITGGTGAISASVYLTLSPPEGTVTELAAGGCAVEFAPNPGRTLAGDGGRADGGPPDAGPPGRALGDEVGCVRVPLSAVGGGRFEGRWVGPPFPYATVLNAGVLARDSGGATATGPGWRQWRLGAPNVFEWGGDLAPGDGPAAGGTVVLIRGHAFRAGMRVLFGDQPAAAVRVQSPNLVEVVTPAGPPGPVDVRVELPLDSGTLSAQHPQRFNYLPPPRIARVDPAEGPAAQPSTVLIDGSEFAQGAVVTVDGAPVVTAWQGDDRLAAEVPDGPAGVVSLVALNPDGQASGRALFTRRPAPQLTGLAPAAGPDLGGTQVTLRGRDLRQPGAVWFGPRPGRVLDLRDEPGGQAAVVLAPRSPAGAATVRWYNPDGQAAELEAAYEYVGPPVLEAAEPGVTSRCGGGEVVLLGRNFSPGVEVTFNGLPAEVLSVDPDGRRMVVRAPPGAQGAVRVQVRNADGRAARNNEVLVYGVQPVIRQVTPAEVPIWGGTGVVIAGVDFSPDVEVRFGDVPAEQWRVEPSADGCDGQILAVAPAHEPGRADVTVRNTRDGGQAVAPGAVTYVAPRLVPNHGLVAGFANVRLEGLDLREGLTVRLAGARVGAAQRLDDRRWRVRTAPGPHGPVALEVRNVDGRGAVLEGAFEYRRFEDTTAASGLQPVGDCNDVSVGDVNGDGRLDLVTANGALGGVGVIDQPVGLHLGQGDGRFRSSDVRPAGNGMNARLGDADGDADLDLLVSNLSGQSRLFRNERGRFMDVPQFPARSAAYDADFVDVDGDGDLDVFVLRTGDPEDNRNQGPDQVWLNDGRGRFEEAPGAVEFDLADVHDHDVGFGDVNGDGLQDLVIVVDNISAQFAGAANRLLLNRGGRFEEAPSPFNDYPGDWLHAELLDLDADGDLDVLLPQDYIEGFSRPGTPAMGVYLNVDGQGTFVEAPELVVGLPRLPAFEVIGSDLDGDGDLDLLVAVYGLLFADGSIEPFESVPLLNDGDGVYHQASSAFEGPVSIASADFGPADFDGDGDLDLFECAARGQSRVWLQR